MRTELSSLDLYFLLKEFAILNNSRINKVYQKNSNFLFQLHAPDEGKKFLRILLPNFIFLVDEKENYGDSEKFVLALRKHLQNRKILDITQKEFERILDIRLDKYRLIIELFKPGNLILCEDGKIVMAMQYKAFSSRLIRPGIQYVYPKKEYNFVSINETELTKLLETSDKDSVVITLAVNLGLGGFYAEELCIRAKIDKKKLSLDKPEIRRLYNEIEKIRRAEIDTCIYYDNNEISDITPFEIIKYKGMRFEKALSFNHALSIYLSQQNKESNTDDVGTRKLESIKKNQEAQILGFEKSYLENKKKGEVIYENYMAVSKILNELKKTEYSDISKKKYVKEFNRKNKKVVVEI